MAQLDTYISKEIGNYRIEQEIASGSFGTVYLARHLHLKQRTVVIKILHILRLDSAQEQEQFLQEAQILETLKGLPNILPLLDVGIDGQLPYMIAEYAEHGSLRMYMQQNGLPLPVPEALRIIEQVGNGLENAHNQGIVHRDLKPENILFNAKDEALLADFGLSTILSTASITYTRVEGTPAYMAPEQFAGEVSKESDQYALACITYELLTGHKLFAASNFFTMGFLHATKAPTPPRQLNPDIPASVEHALLKALSKDRTERYPSVSAFVASLNILDDSAQLLPAHESPTLPASLSTPSGNSQTLLPSSLPGMPTRAFYPLASNMTATSPNPIVSGTYPPMPASSAESGPVWSPLPASSAESGPVWSPSLHSPSPVSSKRPAVDPTINLHRILQKHKKRTPTIIALVLVILLILGTSAWAMLTQHSSQTTITITPFSKTLQDTFTLTGINGSSNIAHRQVNVRQLTSTKTDTQPVSLTYGHQDPTPARGSITFFNSSFRSQTVAKASVTFQVGNIQIVIDQDATVPAAREFPRQNGQITVPAHAVQSGTAGNIAASAINTFPCCGFQSIAAINQNAFAGGTDIADYNYLKPDDVNAVTTADQGILKNNAQNNIIQQKKPGEELLGNITCNDPKTTESIQPNIPVATATSTASVTVSVTCNAQVYDANATQTIAHNSLSQKASTDPQLGPEPIQSGPITTQIQLQTQPDSRIAFSVTASSLWHSNWTDAKNPHIQLNTQHLLNQIKGMTKTQAQHILNNYPGIRNATITITNNGTTLPSNIDQITLKINAPQASSPRQ